MDSTKPSADPNLESACRLINPLEWDALTASLDDYDRICIELGINRGQFLAYRDHRARKRAAALNLHRLGSDVYLSPKMGTQQYLARVSVTS